jgi:hypothetical protein
MMRRGWPRKLSWRTQIQIGQTRVLGLYSRCCDLVCASENMVGERNGEREFFLREVSVRSRLDARWGWWSSRLGSIEIPQTLMDNTDERLSIKHL